MDSSEFGSLISGPGFRTGPGSVKTVDDGPLLFDVCWRGDLFGTGGKGLDGLDATMVRDLVAFPVQL